jgi:hypothetical protein
VRGGQSIDSASARPKRREELIGDISQGWNCTRIADQLGGSSGAIDLISLYCKPSQLREWLTCR